MAILLSSCLVLSSCGSLNNTAKGGMIGGGSGAALGAIIGGIAGHGKGAAIGAAVGAAVGTGAGVLIGKKMDKAAEQAAQIQGAEVEQVTDNNGLQAVKVTFDSGILFNTSSSSLSTSAKASLSKFANNVLNQNPDMDVAIYGYTDNTGWKTVQLPKVYRKPGVISGTCTERFKLSAGMRCSNFTNQECRRYGRKQSSGRQQYGSRT